MSNYSDNYLNKALVVYPPKLKMHRSYLMITEQEETEIASLTNDSALRLYKYYIVKRGWKHFNPLDYTKIGKHLGWSKAKTEKTKGMLVKKGLLLIIKDTLNDGTLLYRVLLGQDIIDTYNKTGIFPKLTGTIEEEALDDE